MRINILAIESSCDESSAAIISNGKILNNIIASQRVHSNYGGVVPELASRAHERNVVEVVGEALRQSQIKPAELNAIAFTKGPGLIGSLLVGASFAKGFALALNIPLIEVNHLQAHVMAHFIPDRKPPLPFLCMTVSGGHTQLIVMREMLKFDLIGQTKDDAVGEAFDKGAKMLGLPYPGGPFIDKLARTGNPHAFQFPGANVPAFDFSFSGIKTSLLYFIRDHQKVNPNFIETHLPDICASYQHQLITMLLEKLRKAASQLNIKVIGLAGGVAANSYLRKAFKDEGLKENWDIYIPDFDYCTDNAAMIAITAHYKFLKAEFSSLDAIPVPTAGSGLDLN